MCYLFFKVKSPSGKFIKAKVIPGTIVVNAADLLERWTSGRIKSTMHRVMLPENTRTVRQSIAFFCMPDNDYPIQCIDGSNKYEPITALEWIDKRYRGNFDQ